MVVTISGKPGCYIVDDGRLVCDPPNNDLITSSKRNYISDSEIIRFLLGNAKLNVENAAITTPSSSQILKNGSNISLKTESMENKLLDMLSGSIVKTPNVVNFYSNHTQISNSGNSSVVLNNN